MSSPTQVASSSQVRLDGPDPHLSHSLGQVGMSSPNRVHSSRSRAEGAVATSISSKGKDRAVEMEEDASGGDVGEGEDETDVDEEDEDEYEAERLRRIEENHRLLDSLGFPSLTPFGSSKSLGTAQLPSTAKRKYNRVRGQGDNPTKVIYDRSGYIVSLPLPGQRHRMACVEMPSDRGLRRRIAEGVYSDVVHWWEGEDRRWKVGHGGSLAPEEEEEVGGVTKDFRWRKWRGLVKELRRENTARHDLNKRDKRGVKSEVRPEGVSAYSLIPGETCHQCKRKSEKLKMRCRNIDPICRASFCETCCKRYSYFDFDPDSRSFICPLCKDCCNCANCIRKRKLDHLLGPLGQTKRGLKRGTVQKTGMTVQVWLEAAIEDKVGAPFDRVRLVDQAFDIISPELPSEPKPLKEPVKKKAVVRKRKRTTKQSEDSQELSGPKPKKSKKQDKEDGRDGTRSLVIRFKVPKPDIPFKTKEVDSDGDTIPGYSDDELDARSDGSSSLTSLSNDSTSTVPPRRAFPPRPAWMAETNKSLATMAEQGSYLSGSTGTLGSEMGAIGSDLSLAETPLPISRRKKPPPMANILRAPKHSSFSSSESPQPLLEQSTSHNSALVTPFTSESNLSSVWTPTPAHPAQTFSYDGYAMLPPDFPGHPPEIMSHALHSSLPPPYSHSPPNRRTTLPADSTPLNDPTGSHVVRLVGFEETEPVSIAQNVDAMTDRGYADMGDGVQRKNMWMGNNEMTMTRMYHPEHP